MDKKKIAEIIFEGERAKLSLEDSLFDTGVPFEELGFDDYDCSLELFDVDDEYHLSVEAQKIIYDAGFSKIYLNHKNKWETHYNFLSDSFEEVEGWRVSYPSKRGKEEKGIWVEKMVDDWPKDWFENGYAIVKS